MSGMTPNGGITPAKQIRDRHRKNASNSDNSVSVVCENNDRSIITMYLLVNKTYFATGHSPHISKLRAERACADAIH